MKTKEDLVLEYLADEATSVDLQQLFAWVRESPENSAEFARLASLHGDLRAQLSADRELRTTYPIETAVPLTQTSNVRRRRALVALAVAACLLIAFTVALLPRTDDPQIAGASTSSFATVAQVVDAKWDGELTFEPGDRVGSKNLYLAAGIVRLRFDDGVEVTLQGPAEYALIAPGKTRLTSGLLTATVPEGAEGFQVETPTAQVIDLGTAFGIELDENGDANVSVFEGEVDVVRRESQEKRLLKEGESLRVASGKAMEQSEIDPTPYEKIWPVSSGIAGSSGAFRLAPPWPRRLRLFRSDTEIFVVPERYTVTLAEPLSVNVSTPGTFVREDELTPAVVATGESVRSFILHYQPEQARPPRLAERITGSIVFDRPVLGLILLRDELKASGEILSLRRIGEVHRGRPMELNGRPAGDQITLSPDRRTVNLSLAAPHHTSDLVRVIVDASIPSSADK